MASTPNVSFLSAATTPVVPQSRFDNAFTAAAEANGVDFEYLLSTAKRESALNPEAKAKTSSASGLFQFIESTWLETMKRDGPSLGYQSLADQIDIKDGRYTIADPNVREHILSLRNDPEVAANMAGALTRRNGASLEASIGRSASDGELYIAHFLGAKGAANFIKSAEANPDASAAERFPVQAKANQSIFYNSNGNSRTMGEVYEGLIAQHRDTTLGSVLATHLPQDPTKPIQLAALEAPGDYKSRLPLAPQHYGAFLATHFQSGYEAPNIANRSGGDPFKALSGGASLADAPRFGNKEVKQPTTSLSAPLVAQSVERSASRLLNQIQEKPVQTLTIPVEPLPLPKLENRKTVLAPPLDLGQFKKR